MLSNYDPDPNHSGKSLPPLGTPVAYGSSYCTSLTNAYNNASQSFQQALDSLTAAFIDTDSCASWDVCSWGFIDNQSHGKTGNTYIALPSSLWNNADVPIYSQLIDNIVVPDLLIASPSKPTPPVQSPISIVANPDTENLTLIAILAHEMGHMKWEKYDVAKINRTSNSCLDPVTQEYTLFKDIGWAYYNNSPKWQYFGKEDNANVTIDGADKDQLAYDLGNNNNESYDLKTIYDGNWASIFSTVSPNEDYVETYTLIQLVAAGTSLQVTLIPNNQTVNLMNYFNGATVLNHKVQWIGQCAN